MKSAMRVSNMANTFYLTDSAARGGGSPSGQHTRARDSHKYVHRVDSVHNHPIWRKDGFWDMAMLIGVANQLDLCDPVLWEDVPEESLKEIVIGMHD